MCLMGMRTRIENESDENKINIFPLFSSVVLYSRLGMLLEKRVFTINDADDVDDDDVASTERNFLGRKFTL